MNKVPKATSKQDRLASCMDDHDPHSLTIDKAMEHILASTQAIAEKEPCPLKQALGRVLAEDLHASIAVPNHSNSAMDGYAILASDIPQQGTKTLHNIGTAFAGEPFTQTVQRGECVRIMTGACVPTPCDTVIIQEKVSICGDQITISGDEKPKQNVRNAGEDIQQGANILQKGKRLLPAQLGLIASCGIHTVQVWRKPRIAFFSSGNELIPCGDPLEIGQVYDSNRYTLYGMLERLGVCATDLGIVRDDPKALRDTFDQAIHEGADVVITSGGVSVGEKDYMHEVLDQIGQIALWKVAIKPGRPLMFGKINKALYFGLPGNPVSVMVVFYMLVQPALRKLMGECPALPPWHLRARCNSDLRKRPGRVEYQRGLLKLDGHDEYQVNKTGEQGSGILTSMSEANCFIILPMDCTGVEAGDWVDVVCFDGLV
ncbi:MAG: gephyrin-like molybdotransferase Glp [Candidatus Oxydemutatoraceae bacterium WSBS_2016_MAG_OTU14]